jgi:hypothetical protein
VSRGLLGADSRPQPAALLYEHCQQLRNRR